MEVAVLINGVYRDYYNSLNKVEQKRFVKVLGMYKVFRPYYNFKVVELIKTDNKLSDTAKEDMLKHNEVIFESFFGDKFGYIKTYNGISIGDIVYVDGVKNTKVVWEFEIRGNDVFAIVESYNASMENKVLIDLVRKEPREDTTCVLIDSSQEVSKMSNLKVAVVTSDIHKFLDLYADGEYDFNPCYQRGLVWSLEQKQAFILALFSGKTYLKPTFLFNGWFSGIKAYEVIDGKQRLNTIIEFVKGQFAVNGYYYKDLGLVDVTKFSRIPMEYTVIEYYDNVRGIVEMPLEQRVELFLQLNEYGQRVDQAHLDKIKSEFLK
jgi:hypothetical protein